ncbi:MAG: translation initiation factor [Ginsengibacter sp.]
MSKRNLLNSGIVYSTDSDVKIFAEEIEDGVTLPTGEQSLTVKLDTKQRGGKTVTLIKGFSGRATDLENLGKQLKSYCGTGGSVKNNEILIQGDNLGKVLKWLKDNGYSRTKKI